MNKRIEELAKQAGGDILFYDNGSGIAKEDGIFFDVESLEKFAELIVKELVSKIEVEGCDFWYNETNDYGRIKVRFFMGGDPKRMCGEEIVRKYVDGMRPSGFYRLNDEFVKHLMKGIAQGVEE